MAIMPHSCVCALEDEHPNACAFARTPTVRSRPVLCGRAG